MHIIENYNARVDKVYCYISECIWDKQQKKYLKPRTSIGHLSGDPPKFIPNKRFSQLLAESKGASSVQPRTKRMLDTIAAKYGEVECLPDSIVSEEQTARAIFSGPSIVFGGITTRYHIDTMLNKAFGEDDAKEILSLAWYITVEGSALSNSDAWFSQYETPAGRIISSQEITRLLDRLEEDAMMTFYKEWMNSFKKTGDRILYDLTSISWYGRGIDMAKWGHNRDNEDLPQVNFALLCARKTAIPLFAWPLDGSVTDIRTLQNTLQFLNKLDYKPDSLMMDRGFACVDNISYLFKNKHVFLQALRVNAQWIYEIIDDGNNVRLRPDSMLKMEERTYYVSTTQCQWVIRRRTKKDVVTEDSFVHICKNPKRDKYIAKAGEEILSQSPCKVHVLFCQDLIGNQWDRFMENLKYEHERLLADEKTEPAHDWKPYFKIFKDKWARKRTVEFVMEKIAEHRNNYAGYLCFLTNDNTVQSAQDALTEYSTRDSIEKDFDEMKNDLDMRRIRVHTDKRMKARLFIQFIAEIYMREIRVRLRDVKECKKMTRKQISSHIKSIYKIKFLHKYRDVCPELSKSQRKILEAIGVDDSR